MVNKYYKKKQAKVLKRSTREKNQNFSEVEKEKQCQYYRDQNKNPSEEEKQKKVEYMRN